ncbi:ankyrin repeat-containing domain protein [Mycena leptocephala]|nr:ankyrin repeat-containing domain protein [Mycena leptocephala]
MTFDQCTLSNPDVSGVGVRAAIYAQNLTCFLPVIVHLWDRKISKDELKGIKDQSIGMLAVAFAILLTTIILAKANWSDWGVALFAPLRELLGWSEGDGDGAGTSISLRIQGVTQRIAQRIWHFTSSQPVLTLGSIHLSLMATVGIWLWSNPSKFGHPLDPSCDPTLTFVGVPAHFSSKPLHIASLMMYSLVLIPGLNLIPPFAFFLTLHISYNWSRERHQWFWKRWDEAILKVFTLRKSPTSSDSEQGNPSRRSSPGDQNGDDAWGFRQVLALLLLIIPLRDAWGPLQEIRERLREKLKDFQEQFEELLLRECQATPAVEELDRLIQEGANPKQLTVDTRFANSLQLAGKTALHSALARGHGPILKILLQTGTYQVHLDDERQHYSANFFAACVNGNVEMVNGLLLLGAKLHVDIDDMQLGGGYGTALCAASANGKTEVVKALLGMGAKLDAKESGGRFGAPLHVAVLMENREMVELLMDPNPNGADCNWDDFGGAVDIAGFIKNEELFYLLWDRGLRPHNRDRDPHYRDAFHAWDLASTARRSCTPNADRSPPPLLSILKKLPPLPTNSKLPSVNIYRAIELRDKRGSGCPSKGCYISKA